MTDNNKSIVRRVLSSNRLYFAVLSIVILTPLLVLAADCFRLIYHDFGAYPSPEAKNTVIVKTTAPAWPFGTCKVKIICRNNELFGFLGGKSFETEIANDGGRVLPGDVLVKWSGDDEATITLDGCEQEREVFEVSFGKKIIVLAGGDTNE